MHSLNRQHLRVLALFVICFRCAHAQQPIDPAQAKKVFAEAEALSKREGGRLWHKPLYGPLIFVDPATNAVVANQQDADGALQPVDGIFAGHLPPKMPTANTSFDWSGTHWTMMQWPLPDGGYTLDRFVAHELFHRLQNSLNIPMNDARNPHLDTLEGRVWLQLEWRALAAALVSTGDAQTRALRDAVAFREHRHGIFAGSAENERRLDLNEGLAEYTGVTAASHDRPSAIWHAVAKLANPSTTDSFVRGFSYTSGPAYGLLLDVRVPGWRDHITPQSDIAALLAHTVTPLPAADLQTRTIVYGEADLRAAETKRAQKNEALRQKYRALLVDGPTLSLPMSDRIAYSFDPNTLLSLDEHNTVFPAYTATDDWGALEATEGLLQAPGKLVVAAPKSTDGTPIQGPGWKLTLSPDWKLVPGPCDGCFTAAKR